MTKYALLSVVLAATVVAQEKPVTISAQVFGDYYAALSHHDPEAEGDHGFWLRRAYLTFDKTLSETIAARLQFEVNQPGDFRTSSSMEPYVKDAWLRWRRSPRMDVVVGISPTPGIGTYERLWGYRPVEKAPLDLHRIVASRDFGIALTGAFDDAKRYRYHVIAGNGSGTGAETSQEKRVGASLSVSPTAATLVELHAEHEARPGDGRAVVQLLAGVERQGMRGGIMLARQMREPHDVDIASVFGTLAIRPAVTLLARVDRLFDPNPEGARIAYLPFDPTSEATMFIAGMDWKAHRNVSVIPNIEVVTYDDGADTDILPRVTLSFRF